MRSFCDSFLPPFPLVRATMMMMIMRMEKKMRKNGRENKF